MGGILKDGTQRKQTISQINRASVKIMEYQTQTPTRQGMKKKKVTEDTGFTGWDDIEDEQNQLIQKEVKQYKERHSGWQFVEKEQQQLLQMEMKKC